MHVDVFGAVASQAVEHPRIWFAKSNYAMGRSIA